MRSRVAAVAAMTAGALALTGCAGAGGGSASGDTLVWSMWIGSTEDQKVWQTVGDAGGEAAGKTVNLQGAPFADYWTKLSTQLGGSSAPCIVSMQSLRVNQFTDGLLPLGDLIEERDFDLDAFDEGALAALAVDGEQYAIPYDTGPMVLFYNVDAFEAAGVEQPEPGWSVDEFEAAAAKLKDNGQVALANTVEDLFLESTVLAYNGGHLLDESGELTLDDPAFAEGAEWLAGLVAAGEATKANGPDPTADDNAFVGGQAASVVGGPWLLLDFLAKAPFKIGVTTVPAGAEPITYSAGSGFGISKTCSDPEAAFDAIAGMTSDEVLSSLAEQGRAFPARTESQQAWYDNAGEVEGLQEAVDAALASSIPLPGSAKGDQLNQLLAQYGPQLVNGDRPAGEVLDEIAKQLGE